MEKAMFKPCSIQAVCPLANCRVRVSNSQFLRHLLDEHLLEVPQQASFGLRMRSVVSGQQTFLLFAPQQLIPGQDVCLGMLNWLPESDDLMEPQSNLPLREQALSCRLPVLVMACKTTLPALVENAAQFEEDAALSGYLYMFWLVAPATSRPVIARLGFLNQQLHCGLRVMRQLRHFASRVLIDQFLLGADRHYLTLNESQMQQMCEAETKNAACYLEVVIVGDCSSPC